MRYLSSPAISDDDLKVLARTGFSKAAIDKDQDPVNRIVGTVLPGLDRWRFPWYAERSNLTEANRHLAVIATTSLIANRRAETLRRSEAKDVQEKAVASYPLAEGFKQVKSRKVSTVSDAPYTGEFCRESLVGDRKADIVIGLGDGRFMPCECKVSISSTNSVKRLNNDAAQKAVRWRQDLKAAQDRGLTIFWSHSLENLTAFIQPTMKMRR